jgi:tripartite-type tricarboxylate transporter receptor subunit TctC
MSSSPNIRAGSFAIINALCISWASAQTYPAKPVRIIVPLPAGGTTDILARMVAQQLNAAWAQPVVIDNRGGANGNIGTEAAVKSPPDGYTLLIGSMSTHTMNQFLYAKLPYDPVNDVAPISLLANVASVLVAHPSLPVKNVKELIALAKARPGQLSFSSAGSGGAPHLAGEMFKRFTATNLLHVPYRGSAPAVVDLIAARITMMFDATPVFLPHIDSGKLRALAAASPQRHRLLPDVPSFAEVGYPGMDIALWYGVAVPGGTPAPIVQRLNAELVKILDMPDIRKSLADQGGDAQGGTTEDFAAFMRRESARWAAVVKQAGIKPE